MRDNKYTDEQGPKNQFVAVVVELAAVAGRCP